MNVTEEMRNGVLVLRIDEARVSARNAADLHQILSQTIDQGHDQVVVDLSALKFLDSMGMAALLAALKLIGVTGNMAMAGVQGAVAQSFRLTHMDSLFALHPTADVAVAQMRV